jgi:hypothetical protein
MYKRLGMLLPVAIAASALACDNASTTESGNGQLNIRLTDAPFPFSEVKRVDVHVVRIDAKLADADSAEAADENDDDDWRTVLTPDETYNLLLLTGGQNENLGTGSLPAGTYRSFRLIIDPDESSVTLNDNSEVDVKWPSAGQSGIKIRLDEPIVIADSTTVLMLDFDVGKSFVLRGNSLKNNGLLFKPVIRAVSNQSTGSVSGSVRGDTNAGAGIAGATVEVLKNGTALNDSNDNNVIATTVTNGSGNYSFNFLPPGTYVIRATPPAASGYKPALLSGAVTVDKTSNITDRIIVVVK